MGFLGQSNRRLNNLLIAKGKKPLFDEDPKGSGAASDLADSELKEVFGTSVASTFREQPEKAAPKEHVLENALAAKALKAAQPKKAKTKKAKLKMKPETETTVAQEVSVAPEPLKRVAAAKPSKKKVPKLEPPKGKVLAGVLPEEMHNRMKVYLARSSTKITSKRELMQCAVDKFLRDAAL